MSLGWPAVAFLLSAGAYLLLAGQVSPTELAACVPAAGTVAAFVALQHRGQRHPLALRAPWPMLAARVLASLLADSLRVGKVLARSLAGHGPGTTGSIDRQGFHPGGDRPAEAGRRALVTLGASFAPNGFAIDIAPSILLGGEQVMLVHRLSPVPPAADAEWPV